MSPPFSDSPLPRQVPASMSVNHGEAAPLPVLRVPWLILIWHRVLLGRRPQICLFCGQFPACTSPSAHPAAAQEPPATERIANWSGAMSSAWPLYQGNFSIFLRSPQTGPLADANKGLFMGNIAHHLLLHCIFYANLPQSSFTNKCHCLPLTDGTKRKARKVKWFNEGHSKKSEQRWEQDPELPAPRPITCPPPGPVGKSQHLWVPFPHSGSMQDLPHPHPIFAT